MNLPGRRERDERRKFKDLGSLQRMGEALGFRSADYDDVSDAEIVDDTPYHYYDNQGGGGELYQGGGNPPPKREPRRG
jgi:hypothetical protein